MCKNKGDGFIWHSSNALNAAEISDAASACPGCGAPVRKPGCFVHFERPHAIFAGSAVNGVVYIDGQQAGSAANGASFDVYLTYGSHSITFESKITGMLASGRSNADTLNIPYGAQKVNVTIKVRQDALSAFGGATKLGIANVEVFQSPQNTLLDEAKEPEQTVPSINIDETNKDESLPKTIVCPVCGKIQDANNNTCQNCGAKFTKWSKEHRTQ